MSLAFRTKKMIETSSCSICKELMYHPVSINCGHSYCKSCIESYYNKVRPMIELNTVLGCPLCKNPFNLENLRPNKELENIIDVIKEMERKDHEMLCEEHGEKLDLFCEDESKLLCWHCNRKTQHQGHSVALVEDVYHGYKEKLQNTVTKLNKLQEDHKIQKHLMTENVNVWKDAIEEQRQRIQSNFKNLQSFLHEEEKSYLWRLENEEKQVLMRLKDSEDNQQQKSEEIESQIRELEEKCQGSAWKILQDVKNTLNRCEAMKLEPLKSDFLTVHTACNVSELYFDVKTVLRRHQVSVTLDPSTVHPNLVLSKDGKQVTYKLCQKDLEVSAKRFYALPCVLGCENFTSGRYYFEVSVENATTWDVGVCIEGVSRGFAMKKEPALGFWTIKMCEKDGLVALTSTPTPLHLSEKLQIVGVLLDYDAGVVSFYNIPSGSHIFTFPKDYFWSTLRAFFQLYKNSSLFLPAINDEKKKVNSLW